MLAVPARARIDAFIADIEVFAVTVTGITGNGDVDSSAVTTIACSGPGTSGTCTGDFDAGSTVILTADADAGWRFGSWGGDCGFAGTSDTCTFNPLNADQTAVTATFIELFDVTVTAIAGNGDVDSTTTGAVGLIACTTGTTGTCTDEFDENSDVTLTATPDASSVFGAWAGDCAAVLINVCTLSSIAVDKNVSVTFVTPEEATEELIEVVEDLGLPMGTENSFTKKLDKAIKSLNGGKIAKATEALNDFISEANAQRGKKLTDMEADDLIALANAILAAI